MFEQDTLWLSLLQIAELFERDKSVISRYLKNIFNAGELVKNSVVAKNATTATDGKSIRSSILRLCSASPETLYPNKKQQVARSYGDKEF
ncbi:hypothetical protein [Nitrosomonas sp.]|uniref:hypothetical protein n=1 Tax=Nitrosomonas sp. TaxID=42353 RepID=UPI0027371F54|nr:hypothetical protein [Nitrosomonas sp.]